ncbi:lamin tail domain-containing protein [Microbacterium sp. P07]|uniref:lamin tail domain-containing protein n=1 Tax=Microbacterium sp. P07 TaxID=3366952 RepID=UPI0037474ACD
MPVPRSLPAVGVVVALFAALAVAPTATAAPVPAPPIVVTEIVGDTVGVDTYEYVEVHNTTDAPIDLAAAGYSFSYMFSDTADRAGDKALTAEPLVLAAGETALLWVSYTTTSLDSFAHTVDEFRAYHSVAPTTKVARLTGQSGIANGGDRGVRVVQNDATVSWSFVPSGGLGADLAAQFRLPADATDLGLDVLATAAAKSPGAVAPEALVRPTPDPEPEPEPGPASNWPLIVTEVAPDSTGDDNFEFFEVHNPTADPIDLAGQGYSFAYSYVDTDDRARDVPLAVSTPTVIAAGETVVFWLSYTSGNVDSFAKSDADFRAAWGASADTRIVRVTGQNGMANGGNRGVRVLQNDASISWSYYPTGSVAQNLTANFRIPADVSDLGMEVLAGPVAGTPGVVDPAALVGPSPEPTPEPTTEPTTPPAAPHDSTPGFDPQPDAALDTASLQVTEVLPDSAINLGGSDGYEFIEIYNATSSDIDFSDYSVKYLYPDNGTSALWPAVPADVVIPGGETLVFWIKNGGNAALGAAEFNAAFGTSLTMGENLVEITSAGMANGSARGIEIVTNTDHTVSRAFYNMNLPTDDVIPDQGIRYIAGDADPSTGRLLDLAPATPGAVQADQVPAGLEIVPADTVAPTITDRTATSIDSSVDFDLTFEISDDVDARTATLTLANDVDPNPLTINLIDGGEQVYTRTIPAVDLIGKAWYEYSVVVSDGTNETTLETTRVAIEGIDTAPVRLNLDDDQFVSGVTDVIAAGDEYPSDVQLSIGGDRVETQPSLERAPAFAFEVTGVNFYFKNGVRIGDDVLRVFDNTINEWTTLTTAAPLTYVRQGDELVVSVWAGTKKAPEIDLGENNDDFDIRNLRLVLPDGRTITPIGYDDPSKVLGMGDSVNASGGSTGKLDYFDARFPLPADAFSAVTTEWDTTTREDGLVAIVATDGADSATRTVKVDNTAPVVKSTIVDGTAYQGEIVIDADITDAGSGVASTVATLDGEEITLPYTTSSVTLEAGDHVVEITATDALGNTEEWSSTFETYEEQPSAGALAPTEGAEVEAGDVTLQAKVEDPTGDELDVAFFEGERFDLEDGEVTLQSGTVNDALDIEREKAGVLSADEMLALAPIDGTDTEVSSDAEFPYQMFDITVDEAVAGSQVRATWEGRANEDAAVFLYAMRADGSGWDEVDRHVATADDEQFELSGIVDAAAHTIDGKVRMLVQHSEGFAGENLSSRESEITPHNPDDVARSDYDFTLGWESDTQYYNENTMPGDPFKHQEAIHSYLLDQREELNLQYVFHTGDIVDDWDQNYQWEDNASPQYQRLDDAGLPYGVLAGNHDVGQELEDYGPYSKWFGEDRYADNPWYGESYQDNRGHYDLVSAGGIDFIMVFQGWGPGDEEIAWMNEVLAQYPDRVAIIAQHEFILTTGGLGEIPQRILDEVVATNPNVKMVFSGHYHDALTREDSFDDNGDGVNDRTVYSMLFDYQGLPEGGLGYLRLLHFDNEGERMMVRTYSPSLDDYNSDDANLIAPVDPEDPDNPYVHQEFELTYDELGIEPGVRTLGTDGFTAEILTPNEIASFENVASGSILTATWSLDELGEHGWYVRTSDPYGAVDYSRVSEFTVIAAAVDPEEPGTDDPGTDDPGTDDPGTDDPGTDDPGTGGPGDDGSDGTGDPTGRPSTDGDLPATGSDASANAPWALGAGGLLLAGALLLLVRRRRAHQG